MVRNHAKRFLRPRRVEEAVPDRFLDNRRLDVRDHHLCRRTAIQTHLHRVRAVQTSSDLVQLRSQQYPELLVSLGLGSLDPEILFLLTSLAGTPLASSVP